MPWCCLHDGLKVFFLSSLLELSHSLQQHFYELDLKSGLHFLVGVTAKYFWFIDQGYTFGTVLNGQPDAPGVGCCPTLRTGS